MECIKYFDEHMQVGQTFKVLMVPMYNNDDEQINTTMKFIGTKMVPGFGGYKGNETLAFVFEREDNKKIVLTNYSSCKYNDFTSFFAIYGDCSDGMRYIFLK